MENECFPLAGEDVIAMQKHRERMVDILVASDRVRMVVVVSRFHIVVEAVRVGCSRAKKAHPGPQIAFRF